MTGSKRKAGSLGRIGAPATLPKGVVDRAFTIAQWATERNLSPTAKDLMCKFGLNRATAACYRRAWLRVHGTTAHQARQKAVKRVLCTPPARIPLADLLHRTPK